MKYRGIIRGGVLPSCALMTALLGSGTAFATSYSPAASTPQSKADGLCSLYEAAQAISTGKAVDGCAAGSSSNTITLGKGVYTLTTGILLSKNTVIQGTGQGGSGGSTIRGTLSAPFGNLVVVSGTATTGTTVSLSNVALDQTLNTHTGGIYANYGSVNLSYVRVSNFTWGGISVYFGSLNVEDSTIENNFNDNNGGGISVDYDPASSGFASLVVNRSSIIHNETTGFGGGVYYRGNGNTNMGNTTLGENVAEEGGGIYASIQSAGYFNTYQLTVAHNTAHGRGGGIRDATANTQTNMRVNYSIVNDNDAGADCTDVDGRIFSTRTFYSQFDSSCIASSDSDVWGVNAQLGPLMDMGGNRTLVYPLLKNSPPKDAASGGSDVLDQRGFLRPIDWNGDGTFYNDCGAFEYNPRWEAEQLVLAGSSGEAHATVTGSYSQGKGIRFSANGTNDFAKYELPIAESGDYKVTIGVRSAPLAGTFRLSTATSLNGSYSNIGGTVNLNANTSYYEADLTGSGVKALTQGLRYFQAKVTSCPASTCPIYIDYIKLVRQ